MGPTAGLDVVEKRKIHVSTRKKLQLLNQQLVISDTEASPWYRAK
jgi:hypothetical protein